MRKISKIFYILSIIFSALAMVLYGILAAIFFVGANAKDEIMKKIVSGDLKVDGGTTLQDKVDIVVAIYIVLGVLFVAFFLFSLIALILAVKGKNSKSVALHVVNIVFGVLSSVVFNIPAGILGIIATTKGD